MRSCSCYYIPPWPSSSSQNVAPLFVYSFHHITAQPEDFKSFHSRSSFSKRRCGAFYTQHFLSLSCHFPLFSISSFYPIGYLILPSCIHFVIISLLYHLFIHPYIPSPLYSSPQTNPLSSYCSSSSYYPLFSSILFLYTCSF